MGFVVEVVVAPGRRGLARGEAARAATRPVEWDDQVAGCRVPRVRWSSDLFAAAKRSSGRGGGWWPRGRAAASIPAACTNTVPPPVAASVRSTGDGEALALCTVIAYPRERPPAAT